MSGSKRFQQIEAPPPVPAVETVIQTLHEAVAGGEGFDAAMRVLVEVFSARVVRLHADDLDAGSSEYLAIAGAHDTQAAGFRYGMGICLHHDGGHRFVVLSLSRSSQVGPFTIDELLLVKSLRPHLVAIYKEDARLQRAAAARPEAAPGTNVDLAAWPPASERRQ